MVEVFDRSTDPYGLGLSTSLSKNPGPNTVSSRLPPSRPVQLISPGS